jgi:UDP-N-acetylmuramoyl-tripeptide--D-alanyl-D-alanine ligase
MREWTPAQIAAAAGARLLRAPAGSLDGPERVTIDSRDTGPGTLFVGLPGERVDGGAYAAQALDAGAWGVLVAREHAELGTAGVILSTDDPLRSLQRLATAWRRRLGARVIGVTGSTGKTSTKDIMLAVLRPHRRTVASRANFNTEIGLPLEILSAPAGTEVLVLEMGMRGRGQIAELGSIAEPDVAVIVSVGPVHLELLGSLEAIAAAKAELIEALPSGGAAIIPVGQRLLAAHIREDVRTVTFGDGGDVRLLSAEGVRLRVGLSEAIGSAMAAGDEGAGGGETLELEFPFSQSHLRSNLLAAVAAALAVGVRPEGRVEPTLSSGRGQRIRLPGGATLIDDCYNANPMSMRAALDDLATTAESLHAARRVAVLGDMLELGPTARDFHVEIGHHADAAGVDLLVTVGPLAAAMADGFAGESYAVADASEAAAVARELVEPRDVVLVKASRGVGLEAVCGALQGSAVSSGEPAVDT